VGIDIGGNCPRWELPVVGIVRGGSCPRWEFDLWWELSAVGIALETNYIGAVHDAMVIPVESVRSVRSLSFSMGSDRPDRLNRDNHGVVNCPIIYGSKNHLVC